MVNWLYQGQTGLGYLWRIDPINQIIPLLAIPLRGLHWITFVKCCHSKIFFSLKNVFQWPLGVWRLNLKDTEKAALSIDMNILWTHFTILQFYSFIFYGHFWHIAVNLSKKKKHRTKFLLNFPWTPNLRGKRLLFCGQL